MENKNSLRFLSTTFESLNPFSIRKKKRIEAKHRRRKAKVQELERQIRGLGSRYPRKKRRTTAHQETDGMMTVWGKPIPEYMLVSKKRGEPRPRTTVLRTDSNT